MINTYAIHLSFIENLWSKQYASKHYNIIITAGPCNPEQRGLWLFSRRAGARVGNLETGRARESTRVSISETVNTSFSS